MKWIIDTDNSPNAQKTLNLLIKNNLNIIAITTVHGLDTKNTLKIKQQIEEDLKNINSDIPVYAGASEPYINYQEELGDEDIINSYSPNAHVNKQKEEKYDTSKTNISDIAAIKINELINNNKKNISILTLSALTNLSLSVLLDNSITDNLSEIIIIGGSTTGKGNSGIFSETNFRIDPVAAKNVIIYYKNLVLLPIEIELGFLNSSLNKEFIVSEFKEIKEYIELMISNKKSILHFIAMLYLFNKNCGKNALSLPADVDIMGKYSRGSIAVERYPWIETKDFNRIKFFESFDDEEIKKTVRELKF